MRIGIISDIHGNLHALDAVLAYLKNQSDRIICLGDVVATGPQPREVIKRLRELNCPVIMGNTDAWILKPEPPTGNIKFATPKKLEDPTRLADIDSWCAEQLSSEDLEYLRTFKPIIEMNLPGDQNLLCFHGSPKSNTDWIDFGTPEDRLQQFLSGFHAKVMAGGHTHAQMLRRHMDTLIVNPGSVGLPYEFPPNTERARNPPWAECAILSSTSDDLSIDFRRVSVNVEAIVKSALESGMPHARWWTQDWH